MVRFGGLWERLKRSLGVSIDALVSIESQKFGNVYNHIQIVRINRGIRIPWNGDVYLDALILLLLPFIFPYGSMD
jgi:hypothetical protein